MVRVSREPGARALPGSGDFAAPPDPGSLIEVADDPLRDRVAAASTLDAGGTMSSGAGDLPPAGSPPLGFVAAARYEIGEEVAAGGMGRIHLAKDVLLGRTIALKLPRQAGATAEERLRQEALITARLQHPGIVPIYEAGRRRWPRRRTPWRCSRGP